MRNAGFGQFSISVILLSGVLQPLSGCSGTEGPPAPERVVTFGTVKYNDAMVEEGRIRFIPSNGPMAMGPVRNGQYRIESKGGVPVGSCRVEIESYVTQGELVQVSALNKTPQKEQMQQQVIPPEYNRQSTLQRTIEAGRENQLDFDLNGTTGN